MVRLRDREVYFSTDIETDGPIPGPHSMLSLGSAAFSGSGAVLGTFEVNFETLPGAIGEKGTMDWWSSQGDAYSKTRVDIQPPEVGIKKFVDWVRTFEGSPVFVGYPATFDFMFVYYYIIKFLGPETSPFSFSALDIKSFAMARLGSTFRGTTKRNMPRHWFRDTGSHTHVAIEDAIEQGHLFCNILRESNRG